uniref:Uncharacterized protein n=1 Tax=Acrobeloides nanus TaxID=290746 RepID=A0A914E8A9_9BILA
MEQYKLIKDAMAIEPAIDYLVRKLEPSTAGCANYECTVNLALSSYIFLTILTVYCTLLLLMFIVYRCKVESNVVLCISMSGSINVVVYNSTTFCYELVHDMAVKIW